MKKNIHYRDKKKTCTKHARTCVYRSKEILITCLNVVGKIKLFRKNENKKYRKFKWLINFKTFELKSVLLQTKIDFPLFSSFNFQH